MAYGNDGNDGNDGNNTQSDSPAAILTRAQRDWIQGKRETTPGSERAIRARVRNRIRAAMLDADLILNNFPPKDIQKALKIRDPPTEGDLGDLVIENGISYIIGLVYLANIDMEERVYADKGDRAENERGMPTPSDGWIRQFNEGWYFERRAEKGIRRALNRRGVSVERVDVTVNIERGEEFGGLDELDIDELAERSENTLLQALNEGEITAEQFADAIKAKGRDIESQEREIDEE